MRDIKYRVWHKINKQMYPVWRIDFDDFGKLNRVYWDLLHEKFEVGHEISRVLELMQFTGLLDKNSKEIYEGDIMKTNFGKIGHVVYWKRAFCLDVQTEKPTDILVWDRSEVIGNIYENPELLK